MMPFFFILFTSSAFDVPCDRHAIPLNKRRDLNFRGISPVNFRGIPLHTVDREDDGGEDQT